MPTRTRSTRPAEPRFDWAIAEGNPVAAAQLQAWTQDTVAPELVSVEATTAGYVGATLTFDEAIGSVSDGDFILVREDGLTASARVRSETTLAGGNTQVVVEAADGAFLPGGRWRVYPTSNITDAAGNAFSLPPASRGDFGYSSAQLNYLPADFNGDQKVNLADFGILRANFNSPGLTGGDANGDGWVNLLDFAMLRSSIGMSIAGQATGDFGGREPTPVAPAALFASDSGGGGSDERAGRLRSAAGTPRTSPAATPRSPAAASSKAPSKKTSSLTQHRSNARLRLHLPILRQAVRQTLPLHVRQAHGNVPGM